MKALSIILSGIFALFLLTACESSNASAETNAAPAAESNATMLDSNATISADSNATLKS